MLAIASKLSRDGGSFQVSTEEVDQFGDRSRNVFGLVVRIDMGCPVDQMEVRAAEAPAAAPKVGDSEPSNVVQAFARSGGFCEPERHRYVVLFGELAAAHHVAIVVPGVGDETNLLDDWLPAGANLFHAGADTAVVARTIRLPTVPVRLAGRRYRGPGYRLLIDAVRLVDFNASQTGSLVRGTLEETENALSWLEHRLPSAR